MYNVDDKVLLNKSGMCSEHKGQIGTIVKINNPGLRASYFIKFDDGKVEIQREQHFTKYIPE
ncbi:MAG: hypothetical protein HC836_25680 [Richelia sp. RM2_1_2]|nr:hypothetical protein [Richelia sp. RM2_1_2]